MTLSAYAILLRDLSCCLPSVARRAKDGSLSKHLSALGKRYFNGLIGTILPTEYGLFDGFLEALERNGKRSRDKQ
jgi:hypothetical protein